MYISVLDDTQCSINSDWGCMHVHVRYRTNAVHPIHRALMHGRPPSPRQVRVSSLAHRPFHTNVIRKPNGQFPSVSCITALHAPQARRRGASHARGWCRAGLASRSGVRCAAAGPRQTQ
jgi:hypothetical protein